LTHSTNFGGWAEKFQIKFNVEERFQGIFIGFVIKEEHYLNGGHMGVKEEKD